MQTKKKCFVIMPVSGTESCSEAGWTSIFEEMIKPAVVGSRLGLTCERAKPRTGNLIRDILNELNKADVVVADLTDMNANVFYELGVRHALRNRTILIAQDMKYVPSDLRSYWVIIYRKDLSGLRHLKDEVKRVLREMMKNPDAPDNPVADFLVEKNVYLVSQERASNSRKLAALVGELSSNLHSAELIAAHVKKGAAKRKKGRPTSLTHVRFDNTCLSLLAATRYIELSEIGLEALVLLNTAMLAANKDLDLCQHESFVDSAQEAVMEGVPHMKSVMVKVLKELNQVRLDYMSNNYQEASTPVVLLSSEKHRKYIEPL